MSSMFLFPEKLAEKQEIILFSPEKDGKYVNCDLCDMEYIPRKYISNSTPRDAILLGGQGSLKNLFPFIKSLRTVGCLARVIVFADNEALTKYTPFYYEKAKNCGIEFVEVESSESLIYSRFEIWYDYLIKHRHEYDRIIQMDLFDAIFQYDPFTVEWDPNKLYVQTECDTIYHDFTDYMWTLEAYDNHSLFNSKIKKSQRLLNRVVKEYIINGGGQLGNIENMIKLDSVMLLSCRKNSTIRINDQGLISYIVHSGVLKDLTGIKPVILPFFNDIFMSVNILVSKRAYDKRGKYVDYEFNGTKLGAIYFNGKLPAVIHQFDRDMQIIEKITDACPNKYNPPFEDYIRVTRV